MTSLAAVGWWGARGGWRSRASRRSLAGHRGPGTDPVDLPEALAALAAGDGQRGQVSYEVRGTPRQAVPETSLAVYRTAQEALANARKHAPGAAVAVTLCFRQRAAALRVANGTPPGSAGAVPGPGESLAATGGGYGLTGRTERAELLGGTLRAGPGGDDWVVELTVPG